MKLTPQQFELLEIAKKKGYFTFADAEMVYSSKVSRADAISRLVLLGLVKDTGIKFKLNLGGKKIWEKINLAKKTKQELSKGK